VRVRDVMASPVVTVAPSAALKEVASLLVERRINAVPVVDAGDRLIGIVSEADLLSLETGQVAAARLMLRHRQRVEQLARAVPGVVEVRSRRPDPAP